MERFTNQPLPDRPHIAVLGSDKVGNFVVTTPLLRGLREKYPAATVDFFGSEMTRSFESLCLYIDARVSLFGAPDAPLERLAAFVRERSETAGSYDLAINCNAFSEASVVLTTLLRPRYVVGRALSADLRGNLEETAEPSEMRSQLLHDNGWNRPGLAEAYPGLLQSGFIAEILCRLAFVETDFFRADIPVRPPEIPDIPPVLIHTTASRPAKEWPVSHWTEVVRWCRRKGWQVGMVGSCGSTAGAGMSDPYDPLLGEGVRDLRNALSLPGLAGAFQHAKAAVVVDSGPMHVAAAAGCQTLCLFGNDVDGDGASPFHLWAPRGQHIHIVRSPFKCRQCIQERFRNRHCLVMGHPCLESLRPDTVIHQLRDILTRCD